MFCDCHRTRTTSSGVTTLQSAELFLHGSGKKVVHTCQPRNQTACGSRQHLLDGCDVGRIATPVHVLLGRQYAPYAQLIFGDEAVVILPGWAVFKGCRHASYMKIRCSDVCAARGASQSPSQSQSQSRPKREAGREGRPFVAVSVQV